MIDNADSTDIREPSGKTPPHNKESGATLPIVGMMLFVLIGLAAFAIDLGWFYLNTTRVQRAADAAALAGVINMPYDFPAATVDAKSLAATNGYPEDSDTTVTVSTVTGEPNMIQVRVEDTVPTFFLKVFGRDTQVVARAARAEFVPPLPLGSPDNQFGNSCDPEQAGCSGQPNFWANIHGKYTQRAMGDAYGPICTSGNGSGCTANNPIFRDRGYLYGIEAPAGTSFSVNFTDVEFHNISGGVSTNDNHRTGDRGCEDWGNGDADCGQTVITTLYEPDADPLVISNNTEICSVEWDPVPQVAETVAYVPVTPACMSGITAVDGIYVLQVRIEEPPSRPDSGLNRYGLSVSAGARLYGLGDMSIYNNFSGSVSEFYLAEVGTGYRGKTFVVELFDPGEGNGWVQLMAPDGVGDWDIFDGACSIYTRPSGVMTGGWNLQSTPGTCQFQADNSVSALSYQDRWVKVEIQLPDSYDCEAEGNCWWKINYDYSGGVNDTTTWRAYIVGNPIHLVPTGG